MHPQVVHKAQTMVCSRGCDCSFVHDSACLVPQAAMYTRSALVTKPQQLVANTLAFANYSAGTERSDRTD